MLDKLLQNYSGNSLPLYPQGTGAQSTKRVTRRPRHHHYVHLNPYEITPFMVAPVLPAETLTSALLNARSVTAPVANRITGWWHENYFFYVPLLDIFMADDDPKTARESLMEMIVRDNSTAAPYPTYGSDNAYFFAKQGAPAWLKMAYEKIVRDFFRDEDDTGTPTAGIEIGTTSGLARAYARHNDDVMQSLRLASEMPQGADVSSMSSLEELWSAWQEYLLASGAEFQETKYEDYLKSFGINVSKEETLHKMEALRYTSHWSYPTNTVGEDGSANTQVLWSIMDRMDKRRFFKHPGFIIGLTCVKPKVYIENRQQAAISLMHDAESWLPAALQADASSTLITIGSDDPKNPYTATPFEDGESEPQDIVLDVRDLLIYGDEFVNTTGTDIAGTKPTAAIANVQDKHQKRYLDEDDVLACFAGENKTTVFEGVTTLNIKGRQKDMT